MYSQDRLKQIPHNSQVCQRLIQTHPKFNSGFSCLIKFKTKLYRPNLIKHPSIPSPLHIQACIMQHKYGCLRPIPIKKEERKDIVINQIHSQKAINFMSLFGG